MSQIKLAILMCDHNLPEIEQGKQTLPILWSNFFQDTPVDLSFYRVFDDEWPDVNDFDNFLITGSRHSVLDDFNWMKKLAQFIQAGDYQKLVGICFGHQMIANSLGGKVVSGHWHVGVRDTIPFHNPGESKHLVRYNHQDHVVDIPLGATQTYTSDNCEVAGFVIGDKVLTFQFHPEFTERYHKLLHDHKRENFTQDEFIEAIKYLDDPTDHDLFKQKIITFLG